MIQIKPYFQITSTCDCGGEFIFSELVWQGLHVCEKTICNKCYKIRYDSLPVNQAALERYTFYPQTGEISDQTGRETRQNWYSAILKTIAVPDSGTVSVDVEILDEHNEVIILNTLDYIYGHSFLFLLNLQRLIESEKNQGIIVIVQPMLKWLLPKHGISEVWTVNLGFRDLNKYYPDLSEKINYQLGRFSKIWLSKGHIIPTNRNIDIELFSGIKPFDFKLSDNKPRITFIWREDPDRLWIRNIFILKGFKKLGFKNVLIPFHYTRVILFFLLLRKKIGRNYLFTVAGPGKAGWFPSYIEDKRINVFNEVNEKMLCRVYAESALVVGVHGSGMLLPSAHAGMVISLMPSRRWGNYAEDVLFTEQDVRLASFQRRIVPLNLCIFDIRDIAADMITGRDYFINKFMHSDEL